MNQTPFGRYIRERRLLAGLSLRAVADAIGVSHVYLAEVERGVKGPFKKERWTAVTNAIPGVTEAGLESAAATTRPLQIRLDGAPLEYQNLALALARRIEKKDLKASDMREVLDILGPYTDGEE